MELGEKLNAYRKLLKEIHEYFGYKEDWVVIPIEDRREFYWHIEGAEDGGEVQYHEKPLTADLVEDGAHYEDSIYTQRFLPKWVYRAEKYTMICVDTHTDGNKFLAIFANDKEQKVLT